MRRMIRILTDGLALLLGLNPNQRGLAVLLLVAGLVTLDWFSATTLDLLTGTANWHTLSFWAGMLSLPLVFLAFLITSRQVWLKAGGPRPRPVTTRPHPVPSQGLILFLSTFTTFNPKLPSERAGEIWKGADLLAALAASQPDWPRILDHVQASNIQVPLEAVRYHVERGALRHVWVLTTPDTLDATGKVERFGSRRYAAAFEQILREALDLGRVQVHHTEPELTVLPYDLQQVFGTVDRIYRQEVPRAGLAPAAVIADITGGTVTMTAGMLLACALLGRRVQFTAAQRDPSEGQVLERPTPYAIQVDDAALRRLVLRHIALESANETG